MVVVKTEVGDVDLDLFSVGYVLTVFAELLPDFEEALLDFPLHSWLELLLHVVKFQVLPFEVLEWI